MKTYTQLCLVAKYLEYLEQPLQHNTTAATDD